MITISGHNVAPSVLTVAPCERWTHQDRLGCVVMVTNSAGGGAEKYRYGPYGELGSQSASGFPFRYTGQKLDAATGLYHYKARFYDPEVGRFLQTDPIGYDDQMNLYAYVANDPVNATDVHNDPVNATDPTGMCTGSRITNDDGTCRSTGGFTTGTDGLAQGMQIDRAVGQAFVRASGETNVSASETRAAGRAYRASYNGSDRQFGFGSRVEVRAAAAGALSGYTPLNGNDLVAVNRAIDFLSDSNDKWCGDLMVENHYVFFKRTGSLVSIVLSPAYVPDPANVSGVYPNEDGNQRVIVAPIDGARRLLGCGANLETEDNGLSFRRVDNFARPRE